MMNYMNNTGRSLALVTLIAASLSSCEFAHVSRTVHERTTTEENGKRVTNEKGITEDSSNGSLDPSKIPIQGVLKSR